MYIKFQVKEHIKNNRSFKSEYGNMPWFKADSQLFGKMVVDGLNGGAMAFYLLIHYWWIYRNRPSEIDPIEVSKEVRIEISKFSAMCDELRDLGYIEFSKTEENRGDKKRIEDTRQDKTIPDRSAGQVYLLPFG